MHPGVRDKMILWPSYLHNGISYTGKMTSLYWIKAQSLNNLPQVVESRQRLAALILTDKDNWITCKPLI